MLEMPYDGDWYDTVLNDVVVAVAFEQMRINDEDDAAVAAAID